MTLPINRWTVAVLVTLLSIYAATRVKQEGDYDFGPQLAGFAMLILVVALWFGVLLATFL